MTTHLEPALAGLPSALAGEFVLERELGRGGMGVVFCARDVRLDRQVALKVLPPDRGADPEIRARFLREARTAGQLSHPHIVHIHRADERGEFAFFVMGLVDGETLAQRVQDRGPLPPVDAVRHLREVSWALAYAHARGVIHRDVKPENIMIERGSNRALVTDFGIARVEQASGLTSDGHILGTAHFMSPEQIQGNALDGRSDLYALGVVGYYLLSGHLPFEGERGGGVLVAHVSRPAPSLAEVAPQIPRALVTVIDRCLSKDPAQRFETGEDLSEALRQAMEGAVASREPVVVSSQHRALSEGQASLVWRRAAQLQAEAAARLERESRTHAARLTGSEAVTANDASSGAPLPSYRVRDVEAAAVEAGISQRFVALALSELPVDDVGPLSKEEGSTPERVGTSLLGPLRRSLSVSRVIRAPARDVLRAIGRTFQGTPFLLALRDQLGPHPLAGGILVFRIGSMRPTASAGHSSLPFNWVRNGLGAIELRTTLRPLEQERGATEVTVIADLRPGIRFVTWWYGATAASLSVGAGAVGLAIGMKVMAIAGALLAAPILVTAVAGAALAVAGSRATYRWSIARAARELDDLLRAVEDSLRSRSVFDEDPPAPLPPSRPADTDDGGWIASTA